MYQQVGSIFMPRGSAYRHLNNDSLLGWDLFRVGEGDSDFLPQREEALATSNDIVRNDPLGAGFLKNYASGVIGLSINPEPNIDYKLLGIKKEQAEEFNQRAEKLWLLYTSSPDCDFARKRTFWQLENYIFFGKMRFGDVFVIRRFRKDRPFYTSLQVVEGHRVEDPCDGRDTSNIRCGVEIDPQTGERKRFFVRNRHPDGLVTHEPVRFRDKGGYIQAVQIMREEEGVEISRGVPLFNAIVTLLHRTGQYTEGEAKAAVLNAFIAFYTTTDGGASPFGDTRGVTLGAGKTKENPRPKEIRSGDVFHFGHGGKLEALTPGRPNPNADGFLMAMVKFMACYLQIPSEVLLGEFNSSYSASRAAIMQAHREYRRERQALVQNFHQVVWEWFISECISRELLEAPGYFSNPIMKSAYLQCEWFADAPPNLDLSKEAKGAREFVEGGFAYRGFFTRTILGLRYDRVMEQRRREGLDGGNHQGESPNQQGKEAEHAID